MLGNKPDPFEELFTEAELFFNNEFGLTNIDSNIRIDVSEEENQYNVTADIPGFKPEDIEITLQDRTLTIETSSEEHSSGEETNYHVRERLTKEKRTVRLPSSATSNPEEIDAEYKNGVLHIEIPKETDMDNTVEINVKTSE